ncbi:MAG TPA: FG-GAP repeat protein [Thermoleophilaceae bacterium]
MSAALGRARPAYRVRELQAHNPEQRLGIRFSKAGVTVSSERSRSRFDLVGYGRAGAIRPVARVGPRAVANRVDYSRPGLDEWYANGPLGLEQGFELTARPSGGQGPLTFAMGLSSSQPVKRDGRSALLLGGGLRYGGLTVTDARGRLLRSWLTLHAGRLAIKVDDRGAPYPLRVDPFVQQVELSGPSGAPGDFFGAAVAISGDTVAVSAPGRTVNGHSQQGEVYLFVRPAGGWAAATLTAVLTASDGGANDQLGLSLGISGDAVVAGAPGNALAKGAVYVFVKPPSGWTSMTQTAKLTASDGAATEGFGTAVGISGDTIVAGPSQHTQISRKGEAYVFVKPVSGWTDMTQTAALTASDAANNDFLGVSVAISGDTIVVGASGRNSSQGAVYLYEKPDTGWGDASTESAKLLASDGAANDLFGTSVAIDGGTVVVGAPHHLVGLQDSGAAYVFVKPLFGWPPTTTQTAELTPSDGATNDKFGLWVAVWGSNAIVSSPLHQVGANPSQGAAYLYARPGAVWTDMTQTQELTSSDGAAGDLFANQGRIDGNVAVIGAGVRNGQRGAAYVFAVPPDISITSPANGATYTQGQAVTGSYACAPPGGATITACAGTVPNGAAIDTATPGAHSFSVSSSDSDGISSSQSVSYTVAPRAAPAIAGLKQSARIWREGTKLPSISKARAKKRPVGTTFSFSLNEAARLTFTFSHRVPGRRVGRKCVKPTGKNRTRPRCKRTIVAGKFTLSGHVGANRVRFQGRFSRSRRLKPGSYTLRVTARDSAGASARSRTLSFKIVK